MPQPIPDLTGRGVLDERTRNTLEEEVAVAQLLAGCDDLLEMVGFKPYVAAKKQRNTTPLLHGRRATYVNRGCRCEACREANNAYYRKGEVA